MGDFVADHVDPWDLLGDDPGRCPLGGVGDRAGQRDHTFMSRYTQRGFDGRGSFQGRGDADCNSMLLGVSLVVIASTLLRPQASSDQMRQTAHMIRGARPGMAGRLCGALWLSGCGAGGGVRRLGEGEVHRRFGRRGDGAAVPARAG